MRRHPFRREHIDIDALKLALASRIGHPVEVMTGEPSTADPDGVLVIEHPDTGERLDLDPELVVEAVAATPDLDRRSLDEIAVAEFDAATTVAERLAAYRRDIGRRAARNQRDRERFQQFRDRLRERRSP